MSGGIICRGVRVTTASTYRSCKNPTAFRFSRMRESPIALPIKTDSEAAAKELSHKKQKRASSKKCESYLINKGKTHIPMQAKGDLYLVSLSGLESLHD